MRPLAQEADPTPDLFRAELKNLLNQRHPVYQLTAQIDWGRFEHTFGPLYVEEQGRPGIPTRLMVGLTYLKHTYGLSDEEVVERWVENPYWQYFCGEQYFTHRLPIHPSSLTRWRQKIGEAGCETLLAETIQVGIKTRTVKRGALRRLTVDTTVQEKAVSYPTDASLYNRAREHLVRLAHQHGLMLRQSYARVGPRAARKASAYAHARQMRRARRQIKKLKTILGRVYRDVKRKLATQPHAKGAFDEILTLTERLLAQAKHTPKKLYSIHAPEVECIAKGKVHKKYEFGVKAGIAVTHQDNFVVGARALPGNPYDGHTLKGSLAQAEELSGVKAKCCFVDRGFRGHDVDDVEVIIAGRRRGLTRALRKALKRRNAIEPVIGHLKEDGLLDRNYLKGTTGDAMNVVLCGAGHNLRLILNRIKLFLAPFLQWFRTYYFGRSTHVMFPASQAA